MNGNKFILDTNAIVALLKGNSEILKLTETAEWIAISVISYLEFLAFPGLTDIDKALFNNFIQRIEVIGIEMTNKGLLDRIIEFRMKYKIKLPDSIIISIAFVNNASLVTADKQLFGISEIQTVRF
jgi:hypothetical protein